MAIIERTGRYGVYVGSEMDSSNPLSKVQMETNALYIYNYLTDEGWTREAISGMLGNMQSESSINPGRWQNDNPGITNAGFGLVQWTPSTKYINYITQTYGEVDYTEMDYNIDRILYEVDNNIQWIQTGSYRYSFEDYTHKTDSPEQLAEAFVLCYERPASYATLGKRKQQARYWYEFLGGHGNTPKKKKHFKFFLFDKKM